MILKRYDTRDYKSFQVIRYTLKIANCQFVEKRQTIILISNLNLKTSTKF